MRRLGHSASSENGTSALVVQRPEAALSAMPILRRRLGEGEAAVFALDTGDQLLAGGKKIVTIPSLPTRS